jgi:hypothetical protein
MSDSASTSEYVHLNAYERKRVLFQDVVLNLPNPKGKPGTVEAESGAITGVTIERGIEISF